MAARNLASGAEIHIAADELFPMASCFKIPVMVEVMRRVDAGGLRLDDRLTLTEADKSPGSTLIHCHEGLRPSVRDLLYLMITLSDNTATDMLWRLVGLGSVNETMRLLGLHTIDCFMPNREYFLIESGAGEEWAGLTGPEIVAQWREIEARGEHEDAFRRVLKNARLSGAGFLHLYERRWGRDESLGYEDSFVVDQALDNRGSPRDMAALLAMVAQARARGALLPAHGRGDGAAGVAREDTGRAARRPVRGQQDRRRQRHQQRRRDRLHTVGAPMVMVVFWKGLTTGQGTRRRGDREPSPPCCTSTSGSRREGRRRQRARRRRRAPPRPRHRARPRRPRRRRGRSTRARTSAADAAAGRADRGGRAGRRPVEGDATPARRRRGPRGRGRGGARRARRPRVRGQRPIRAPAAAGDLRGGVGRLHGHDRQGLLLSACAAHGRLSTGGAIVAITDYLGLQPWATFAAHGAAKAAEIHLVKELARPGRPTACASAASLRGRWTWTTTSTAPRRSARRRGSRPSGSSRPATSARPSASAWRRRE